MEHAGIDLLSYLMGKPTGRMLLWNTDKVSSPQGLSIHHNLESLYPKPFKGYSVDIDFLDKTTYLELQNTSDFFMASTVNLV